MQVLSFKQTKVRLTFKIKKMWNSKGTNHKLELRWVDGEAPGVDEVFLLCLLQG